MTVSQAGAFRGGLARRRPSGNPVGVRPCSRSSRARRPLSSGRTRWPGTSSSFALNETRVSRCRVGAGVRREVGHLERREIGESAGRGDGCEAGPETASPSSVDVHPHSGVAISTAADDRRGNAHQNVQLPEGCRTKPCLWSASMQATKLFLPTTQVLLSPMSFLPAVIGLTLAEAQSPSGREMT